MPVPRAWTTTCGWARRRRLLHREARASAGRLRPAGLAALRAVRRWHDHGWGSHHIDCAHWAMGAEHTGPVEIWGTAEFPTRGSGTCTALQDRGALRRRRRMIVSGEFPNGMRFDGTEGWIFVSRGKETVTASDRRRGCRTRRRSRRATPDPHLGDRPGRDPSLTAGTTTATGSSACGPGGSRSPPSRWGTGPARRACSITSP